MVDESFCLNLPVKRFLNNRDDALVVRVGLLDGPSFEDTVEIRDVKCLSLEGLDDSLGA